jgi:hypothetical protein
MATLGTPHITPVEGGAWAVRLGEDASAASDHPTRGLAVAGAFEMLQDRDAAEILVHGEDGRVRSSLTIRQVDDEPEDAALRAEAPRITPSYAPLKAGIGKYPLPPGDFDAEETRS